jgi:cephalosporin hydroxylase
LSRLEGKAGTAGTDLGLPPSVDISLSDPVRDYWLARAAQHTGDCYAGVPIAKFPEDLRVYEHLIWLTRANVVLEIGTQFGGSALWFRDRLRTLASYGVIDELKVVSIDLELATAHRNLEARDPAYSETITLLEGDVRDESLPGRVAELLPTDASCLVVEDSAHVYETTRAALEGFSHFVQVGGFFVVEDVCVDVEEMRLKDDWPRGVLPALRDWLQTDKGRAFAVRRDMELYGMSCHPGGFLQRVA